MTFVPNRARVQEEHKNLMSGSHKHGCTIVDTRRLVNTRITTQNLAWLRDEIHKVNWPGFLGKYSLLTWPTLDPTKAAFDTSMSYFAFRYASPERWIRDVETAQFMLLHCSLEIRPTEGVEPEPATFPPVNTVRYAYSFFREKKGNRMCLTPPMLDANPARIAPGLTSPLNIQYPVSLSPFLRVH